MSVCIFSLYSEGWWADSELKFTRNSLEFALSHEVLHDVAPGQTEGCNINDTSLLNYMSILYINICLWWNKMISISLGTLLVVFCHPLASAENQVTVFFFFFFFFVFNFLWWSCINKQKHPGKYNNPHKNQRGQN